MIQTAANNITVRKSIDEITIRDIENVLSGNAALADSIQAVHFSDDIVITRIPDIDITIKD